MLASLFSLSERKVGEALVKNEEYNLGGQITGIFKELEQAAVKIARLAEEGERQAEIERQRWEAEKEQWRREEAEEPGAKALKESREDLLRIIAGWAESNRIEQFFLNAEQRAAELGENERLRILGRLKRARALVGSIDALDHFMAWRSPDER